MEVVSSNEFAINQEKIFDMALKEQVVIKRGEDIFYLTSDNIVDDDDNADFIEAKSYADDEDTSLADFKKNTPQSMQGVLSQYANVNLIEAEKDAWHINVAEKNN